MLLKTLKEHGAPFLRLPAHANQTDMAFETALVPCIGNIWRYFLAPVGRHIDSKNSDCQS